MEETVRIENKDNARPVFGGLAIAIVVGLVALTRQGDPYMLWADTVFGFVAAGLFLLGLFQGRR